MARIARKKRQYLWMRGLYMLLMLLVLHVCVTLLIIIAVVQLVIALLHGSPNERLVIFGRNLGTYFGQIALFLSFATEEIPFPFSDWPTGVPD